MKASISAQRVLKMQEIRHVFTVVQIGLNAVAIRWRYRRRCGISRLLARTVSRPELSRAAELYSLLLAGDGAVLHPVRGFSRSIV